MIDNEKTVHVPPAPVGVLPSNFQRQRPATSDPAELLSRLVLAGGSVRDAGEICEKNPKAALWLIQKIEDVDELRVRNGRAPGYFNVYGAAARQALARVACDALLHEIESGA